MMKFTAIYGVLLLAAGFATLSGARISAQTPGPGTCPQSGMMNGPMMNGPMTGAGHMPGAHGPADEAYMRAMMGMHRGMMGHAMTGQADRDFMLMMIPHHQAAVDMAQAELKYGTNPQLRAMAKSIVKTQQAEIDRMNALLLQ